MITPTQRMFVINLLDSLLQQNNWKDGKLDAVVAGEVVRDVMSQVGNPSVEEAYDVFKEALLLLPEKVQDKLAYEIYEVFRL
jgi:hypothetical protein